MNGCYEDTASAGMQALIAEMKGMLSTLKKWLCMSWNALQRGDASYMEIPDSDEAVQGAGGCECACRVNTDRDNPQSVTGICVRILDHWGFILDGPNFHTLIDRSSDALAFVWYPGCTPEGIIVGILMLV